MSEVPLRQPSSSDATPIQPGPRRRRRPGLKIVLPCYWAAFSLLQAGASFLSSQEGVSWWFFPAALSVWLLLSYGPKVLPAVILAPLPIDLFLRPMGMGPGSLFAMASAYGLGHALAVLAYRKMRLSPRLRRFQDVAGFLLLVFAGPLVASLPVYGLLQATGSLDPSQLMDGMRTLFLGQALGILTLGPLLLLWVSPLITLGWARLRWCAPPPRVYEFLLQAAVLFLVSVLVVRFSEPGTLHLKYLFFLPLLWTVIRGGLRAASLGFSILGVALTLAILLVRPGPDALLGIQAFLAVLFATTLFLGSAVDAHAAALSGRDRGAHRLNQLMEGTGAIPWDMDLDTGRCGYLGLKVEAILGWPQETWLKQPFWGAVVHPQDHPAFLRFLLEVRRPTGHSQAEFRLLTPSGGEHWVRVAGGLDPWQAPGHVLGFLFDIQAHKRAEENALRASLKEKDLLLREIHHRVKNNLQVISSLLRLQASAHPDPVLQRALQEAQDRIQAIALIHQKLKHAPDFSRLDLPTYVRTLAERLVRSYASVPTLIDLQVEVAEVEIGPDAPVPLGLILNELVANALQHAFPPGEGGSLEIHIDLDPRGWVRLRVADSGQGLPESVELDHGGLGFQLVRALTDQLGGTLELERRRGVSILLSFPPLSPNP